MATSITHCHPVDDQYCLSAFGGDMVQSQGARYCYNVHNGTCFCFDLYSVTGERCDQLSLKSWASILLQVIAMAYFFYLLWINNKTLWQLHQYRILKADMPLVLITMSLFTLVLMLFEGVVNVASILSASTKLRISSKQIVYFRDVSIWFSVMLTVLFIAYSAHEMKTLPQRVVFLLTCMKYSMGLWFIGIAITYDDSLPKQHSYTLAMMSALQFTVLLMLVIPIYYIFHGVNKIKLSDSPNDTLVKFANTLRAWSIANLIVTPTYITMKVIRAHFLEINLTHGGYGFLIFAFMMIDRILMAVLTAYTTWFVRLRYSNWIQKVKETKVTAMDSLFKTETGASSK